jgi:hypothetical protein
VTARPPAPDRYASTPTAYAIVSTVLLTVVCAAATTAALLLGIPITGTAVLIALCLAVDRITTRRRRRRLRIRLRYLTAPRPALVLTDTPRPSCHLCLGHGGWPEPYADDTGEYAGETPVYCDCWTNWHHQVLPVPRALARLLARLDDRRALRTGCSQEPPF